MALILSPTNWIPIGLHGVIPFPEDRDIQKAVENALTKLVPLEGRRSYTDIKYLLHSNPDKSLSIVFELL